MPMPPAASAAQRELAAASLWGTHRPGVYVGVRARAPLSPIVGAMWFDADRVDAVQHVRHDCDERDKMVWRLMRTSA